MNSCSYWYKSIISSFYRTMEKPYSIFICIHCFRVSRIFNNQINMFFKHLWGKVYLYETVARSMSRLCPCCRLLVDLWTSAADSEV